MVSNKKRQTICVGLLVLNIAFIWGNSLMPAQISSAISGFVRDLLAGLFEGGGQQEEQMGDGLLRKLAHFMEFTCLGMLSCWYIGMQVRKLFWIPLIPGIAVACIDELIQCFVPGRGPRITDVGIDALGVLLGVMIIYFGSDFLLKRRMNK